MKLLDSLYTITAETHSDGVHDYTIRLNAEHFIYEAHFPGEPITPGVCIMQIAHELSEQLLDCKLGVKTVKNVKFLRVIVPTQCPELHYTITKVTEADNSVKAQVVVSDDDCVYAKLSMMYGK